MSSFDIDQIAKLVERLCGNRQQTGQILAKLDGHRIDPSDPQHARLLQQFGVDPQELQSGGYARHLEGQDPTAATIGQGALYDE